MRLPKRGEKGFTLIELLIVVAILGVLAAVIIPNVGRFMGRGEEEARRVEFNTVRLAVTAMMVENGIATLPNPVVYTGAAANATSDMEAFPDTSVCEVDKLLDPDGGAYVDLVDPLGDKDGYILYQHDVSAGDAQLAADLVNTVSTNPLTYYYTCNAAGEIRQWASADTSDPLTEYTY